ncbi:hypothetical protein H2199_002350 [Coniosporium tulheliwenetii]|uniref:Uncharacterized protein n=1 Tax=Coniosporium tulheliwenetii TaxID=3383036 RepID=A0ACC2ZIH9_9PEZI|nr:hypothetical protein H2199_002350 [Cladosporium sp. JES 115]
MSNADVSGSVLSIIAAFTSGLDIFKKLAERRRSRKSKSAHPRPVQQSHEELQLGNSLRRGPIDIQREYERNVAGAGWRFAQGDAIAQASLAETLLKLNTGLVGIITSFLSGDKNDVRLDYKSLTTLSDDSRVDAVNTLSHLYHRLSQSDLMLYQPKPGCARCGSLKHGDCSPSQTGSTKPSAGQRSKKQTSSKPPQARPPPKNMVKTEYVIVRRPRNKRATSSSTASSNVSAGSAPSSKSAASTAPTTPCTSPLPSPDIATSYPFPALPLSPRQDTRPSNPPPAYSRNPISQQRTETWAAAHAISELPAHSTTPSPLPPEMSLAPIAHPQAHPIVPPKPPELRSTPTQPTGIPLAARRLNKQTLSTYTFASDSTKLGEIPMRKWIEPYDFVAMEKLNEEAKETGWVPPHAVPTPRPRRGLFRFFRR